MSSAKRANKEVNNLISKRRKVFVEIPRLNVKACVSVAEKSTPRRTSLSVDSESGPGSDESVGLSEEKGVTGRKFFEAVEITRKIGRRYLTSQRELPETNEMEVPGESSSHSSFNNVPVRFLDKFTFYDQNKRILPFDQLISQISSSSSGSRTILGSGLISCCLENGQPPQVTITDLSCNSTMRSLSEIVDYWTDYTTRDLTGLWNIRRIALKTKFAWYILREPAISYVTEYRPFWLAHFVTWRAVHAMRQKPEISLSDFFEYLERVNDSEFFEIMGRKILNYDLTHSSVAIYLVEQLSGKSASLKSLKRLPLVHAFTRNINAFDCASSETSAKTVATTRVFRIAERLFHRSLLVDGELSAHPPEKTIENPPFLHPDNPSKVHLGTLIPNSVKYYSNISIDGETYGVGDTIIVNPGEDRLFHRALNAEQLCSQACRNDFANCVWFCKIRHIFFEESSMEPLLHVQWFQHGSKTILQQTAHQLELFALYECDDIPISAILGHVEISHPGGIHFDPDGYYCRFSLDDENSRFVEYVDSPCPDGSCEHTRQQNQAALDQSNKCPPQMITINNIEYHVDDFVYITESSTRIYSIGQILKFSIPNTSRRQEVEVVLFGRFDDVARLENQLDQQYDERRLIQTGERVRVLLENLEGKCWIADYDDIDDEHGFETYYADQWAATRTCRLVDLEPLTRSIKRCTICLKKTRQARDELRVYKREHIPLRTMELFAGAGGLSTGLEQTGFLKTYWAIEISLNAAATFQKNHPDCIVYNEDTNKCLQSALDEVGGKPGSRLKTVHDETRLMPRRGEVDVIAGGFPCQSFSGLNHQRHNSDDDIRTTLVVNMLSYVDFYRPRFVLMENVKGLLQHHSKIFSDGKGGDIVDAVEEVKLSIVKFIIRTLLDIGYQVQFRVLEAADYGSPQRRERVIFLAARCGDILPLFPIPTYVSEFHKGKTLTLPTGDKLRPVERSNKQCAPFRALTVADAISDLPKFEWGHPGCVFEETSVHPDTDCKVFRAVSEPNRTLVGFAMPVAYRTEPLTRYQQYMRTSEQMVTLHCSRTFRTETVERVWHICSHPNPKPTDLPQQFWTSVLKNSTKRSGLEKLWKTRFAHRLRWDRAFNTALTQCRPFSKGGNTLHPTQKRIITARECARSQGFPDDYHFVRVDCEGQPQDGSKLLDDIHKQIGNAVPVPLAKALGRSIGSALIEQWLRSI